MGRNKPSKKKADPFSFIDHFETARSAKTSIKGDTAIVYDEAMARHECLWDPSYPEMPKRLTEPLERCKELQLLERCRRIPCRAATEEEILMLHTQESIDILKKTEALTDVDALEKLSSKYDAVYIHPETYPLALLAAGSTIELVTSVVKGEVMNGMGLVRPPGHHAMSNEYCGYCFYNNVALGAKHAVENLGVERVAIIDWDVHHGQATQYMFYDDPRVLYLSIHRYEKGLFWPNLRESDSDYIGSGPGIGKNVNIPLNDIGMKNEDYAAILHQIILPLLTEFNPQLIIVSAGYDAAIGCFEGEMEVTPAFYAHMTSSLMPFASGKIAVILEGGYCLKSLSESVALTLKALLGDPCPKLIDPIGSPSDSIKKSILNTIGSLRPYWKCFQFQPLGLEQKHIPEFEFLWEVQERPEAFPTRNFYPFHPPDKLKFLDNTIDRLISCTPLRTTSQVCYAYDERMMEHKCPVGDHPERPERIQSIHETLADFDLIQRMNKVTSRPVTREELSLHTEDHIEKMSTVEQLDKDKLHELSRKYSSVYLNESSNKCALLAAGNAIEVVDAIMMDSARSGLAIVRPPGHHAESDEACGFCLYNNTALAANHALKKFGLKRILIIDWDVHHGNGIQNMFYEDDRVLYISIHRYDNGGFFPCLPEANFTAVGEGKGRGYNVNIAWNRSGMGDPEYLAAFHQIVLPIAYQFDPELVLIASGFDAARGDPLGGCKVTPEGYGRMTQLLSPLAEGRIAVILEGGYNLEAISYSMTFVAKALLGDPLPSPSIERGLMNAGIDAIRKTIGVHKMFWSCLKFFVSIEPTEVEKLAEAIGEMSVTPSPTSSDTSTSTESDVSRPPVLVPEPSVIPSTLKEYMETPEIQGLAEEGKLFAVYPKSWCPHLEEHVGHMPDTTWVDKFCGFCGESQETWTCLKCYTVLCGRHAKGHMVDHNKATGHELALSHYDISAWCYACDSYVDNAVLYPMKNALHVHKFQVEMPYIYPTFDLVQASTSGTM